MHVIHPYILRVCWHVLPVVYKGSVPPHQGLSIKCQLGIVPASIGPSLHWDRTWRVEGRMCPISPLRVKRPHTCLLAHGASLGMAERRAVPESLAAQGMVSRSPCHLCVLKTTLSSLHLEHKGCLVCCVPTCMPEVGALSGASSLGGLLGILC